MTEFASLRRFLDLLQTDLPIIQAPMAGTSSPALAAAVANAGALGSIAVGATNAPGAQKMIADFRERSRRSLHVNVFCHRPAKSNATARLRGSSAGVPNSTGWVTSRRGS